MKLRIEHCDQPLLDDTLLRLAGDLLEDEEADRVNEHLRICWSCGLRAQKARAWLAERKAEVCPRAQALFQGYYEGALSVDQMTWLEAHRLVCTDCWDAYDAYVDAQEGEAGGALTLILGKLTEFIGLQPQFVPAGNALALAGASRPVSELLNVQSLEGHGIRVRFLENAHHHLIAKVESERYATDCGRVELVECLGESAQVTKSAQIDPQGLADFGPLDAIPSPQTEHYQVRIHLTPKEAGKEGETMGENDIAALLKREPKLKELVDKGLVRLPTRKKRALSRPIELPGKPLSAYLDEVRGE